MSVQEFDLIKIIEQTKFLPPYFAVAQKAIRLLNKEDVQIRELASVLETDQALVSKLLGIVNSSFFGLPRHVSRLEEAIAYLGLKETRNVVMALSTRDIFSNGSDHAAWLHSLTTAYLAEAIAKYSRQGADQNSAFTAGLIHDIGIAFIDKKVPVAAETIDIKMNLGQSRIDAEQAVLEMDHTVIAEHILRRWSVPDEIIEAVRHHHFPTNYDNPLCPIVALADQVAEMNDNRDGKLDERLCSFCRISASDLGSLYSAVQLSIANFEVRMGSYG